MDALGLQGAVRGKPRKTTIADDAADRPADLVNRQLTAEAGVESSVGSCGDSYDNALAQTINGLYETEVLHRCGPWHHRDAAEYATLEWVDWFQNRRLLEPIGNIRPAEYESAYHRQQDGSAMVA